MIHKCKHISISISKRQDGEEGEEKEPLVGRPREKFNQYGVSVNMRLGKGDEYNHTHACEPVLTFAKTKNPSIKKTNNLQSNSRQKYELRLLKVCPPA